MRPAISLTMVVFRLYLVMFSEKHCPQLAFSPQTPSIAAGQHHKFSRLSSSAQAVGICPSYCVLCGMNHMSMLNSHFPN